MPFTKRNNTMKQLLLIFLCLSFTFVGCSKYEPLELDFKIGDKNSEWTKKLAERTSNDNLDYSYNLNGKEIKLNLGLNDNILHYRELKDESLVEITISTKYKSLDLDDFKNLLMSLYNFNNELEIDEYNQKINEMKSRTNPLTGLKMAQEENIITNNNILYHFIENTIWSEEIEWNNKGDNFTLELDHLNNRILLTISNKVLLDKISFENKSNYKKEDYIEFNSFDVSNNYYVNFLHQTNFNFKIERRLSSFDKRAVKKVKFNILIKDEFGDKIFSKENLVETLPWNFTNGNTLKVHYAHNSREKLPKNLLFESEVVSVILDDGTVIK